MTEAILDNTSALQAENEALRRELEFQKRRADTARLEVGRLTAQMDRQRQDFVAATADLAEVHKKWISDTLECVREVREAVIATVRQFGVEHWHRSKLSGLERAYMFLANCFDEVNELLIDEKDIWAEEE